MRRLFGILGVLLLIAAVGIFALNAMGMISLNQFGGPPSEETGAAGEQEAPEVQVEAPIIANNLIVVDARVVPIQKANLSLSSGGIINDVAIAEGDIVNEGDLLIRLDSSRQKVAVTRAEAEVARAQANLDEAMAGPRSQEIASAQANIAASQARLNKVLASSQSGDRQEIEAQVSAARASLAKVNEGASEEQLISARAELANSEAAVRRAQNAYNDVKWRNDLGSLPQASELEQATNNLEASKARLADLQTGATAADVNSAQSGIAQAQARLGSYLAVLPSDIAAAEADVSNFQAQLDLLTAGERPETIQAREADVASAIASLQDALVSLAETELRAPFSGTIASVDASLGEQITAGNEVVQIADLENWQIETEDLTELQIVRIQEGAEATIEFDALPEVELTGTVDRIRLVGEDNRGDIVYKVIVIPDTLDERLLWNMTAVVTFE